MDWLKRADRRRSVALLIAAGISVGVGYKFQYMVSNNPDAVNTVVTVFSVLAGFLVAIITLIAEPALEQAKDWEELVYMKKTIHRRLIRHKILFIFYLVTLGVALVMYLTPPDMTKVLKCLQIGFLSLATFVFLVSLTLPGSLMKIQMERYETALKKVRPKVIAEAKEITKSKD